MCPGIVAATSIKMVAMAWCSNPGDWRYLGLNPLDITVLIANVSQMFDKIPCTAMELRLTADLKFA